MVFGRQLLCVICSGFSLLVPLSAHAAFNFGNNTDEHNVSLTGPAKNIPVPAHKVVAPVEPTDPSLQVYQERYVPDAVKKKYGLKDDWFSRAPQSSSQISQPQPLTPSDMVTYAGTSAPTSATAAPPINVTYVSSQPKNYVQSWRARKGENVHEVLHRWSEREQTELMWASEDTPVLKADFSYFGKFQDAVNQLITTASDGKLHLQYRSEGMAPVMMEPASTVTTNGSAPSTASRMPLTVPPVPVQMKGVKPPVEDTIETPHATAFQPAEKAGGIETRWLGLTGAPLAEVLKVWGEEAGVRVVWQSEKNFALLESISKKGTFEEAAYDALSQYSDQNIRPVGEMYKDPQTGERVLVVRTAVDN